MNKHNTSVVALCTILICSAARATVVMDGRTYGDDVFAQTLLDAQGTFILLNDTPAPLWTVSPPFSLPGNASDFAALQTAITGGDLNTAGELHSAYVTLGFGPTVLKNGAGVDLAIFEMGIAEPFDVTINGISQQFMPISNVGSSPNGDLQVNVAYVDLGLFGVADGALVNQVRISTASACTGEWCDPDISAVGGINNAFVPEPSTALSFAVLLSMPLLLCRKRTKILQSAMKKRKAE